MLCEHPRVSIIMYTPKASRICAHVPRGIGGGEVFPNIAYKGQRQSQLHSSPSTQHSHPRYPWLNTTTTTTPTDTVTGATPTLGQQFWHNTGLTNSIAMRHTSVSIAEHFRCSVSDALFFRISTRSNPVPERRALRQRAKYGLPAAACGWSIASTGSTRICRVRESGGLPPWLGDGGCLHHSQHPWRW